MSVLTERMSTLITTIKEMPKAVVNMGVKYHKGF